MTTPQQPTNHTHTEFKGAYTARRGYKKCAICLDMYQDTPQEPTAQEELEQQICRAFFKGRTTQELDAGQVLKFLDIRDKVTPIIEAEATRREREAVKGALEELNQKLFFSTTQPDGQFIKDTILAKLKEIEDKRIAELKAGDLDAA